MFARVPALVISIQAFLPLQGEDRTEAATLSVRELLARMPSEPWDKNDGNWELKSVPAELQRRVESGSLAAADWPVLLVDGGVIHTRTRWPAGEPLLAWVHEPAWLRLTDITLRAVEPDIGTVEARNMYPSWCGNCQSGREYRDRHLEFGKLPLETASLELEVSVVQRANPAELHARDEGSNLLWSGRVRLPMQAVPSVENVMVPVTSDALSQAVRKSVSASWWARNEYNPETKLYVSAGGTLDDFPELRGVALSVSCELHRDGRCVSRTDLVADASSSWSDFSNGLVGSSTFDPTPADLLQATDLSRWDLVLVGKGEGALRVWEADRWWSGRVSIPLRDLVGPNDDK